MPCSPVTVPPRAMAARYSSSQAACALLGGDVAALPDEGRVEVAVAGVPERAAADVVRGRDPLNGRQQLGQPGARRADVLHPRLAQPLHGAEREAAHLAEPIGLHGLGGTRDRGRASIGAAALRDRQLAIGRGAGAIRLDEQQRGGRAVQPEGVPVVDGGDRHPVHELQRARLDAGAGHGSHRPAGGGDGREEGERRLLRWRDRPQLECGLGDDRQRPLRSHDEVGQRVARDVLHVSAAGADDPSIGHHDLQRQDRVAGDAVLHAAQAARIGADVAADRADLVARRIRGVEEALGRHRRLQGGIKHARLDDRHQVVPIDLQDAVHAAQHERQRTVDPGRAAGQPRPLTPRDDRHAVLGRQPHDRAHLSGRLGQRDGERKARFVVGGLVTPERLSVDLVGQQPEIGERGPERVEERRHAPMVRNDGGR